MRPRLLDVCSGAGGAARGYQLAGFEVTGVDIAEQPRYAGDHFLRADAVQAIRAIGHLFDAIHVSPPCQAYLNLAAVNHSMGRTSSHPRLIAEVREALLENPRPYVIESVADARPELVDPVQICGTGLGLPLRRHRLFESNVPLLGVPCAHGQFTEPRYWTSWRPNGEHRLSTVVQIYGNAGGRENWPAAMGIDWMSSNEMIEAIPPAYAEHVGRQLMQALVAERVA